MRKTIKLTESDLMGLVKKIINEERKNRFSDMSHGEFFSRENKPGKWSNFGGEGFDDDLRDWMDQFEKRNKDPFSHMSDDLFFSSTNKPGKWMKFRNNDEFDRDVKKWMDEYEKRRGWERYKSQE